MKTRLAWLRKLNEAARPGHRGETEVGGRKIQNPNSKDQGNPKFQPSIPVGRLCISGAGTLYEAPDSEGREGRRAPPSDRSADFPVCCIADFPVGQALNANWR